MLGVSDKGVTGQFATSRQVYSLEPRGMGVFYPSERIVFSADFQFTL